MQSQKGLSEVLSRSNILSIYWVGQISKGYEKWETWKNKAQFFCLIFQTILWYSWIVKYFILSILEGEINGIHLLELWIPSAQMAQTAPIMNSIDFLIIRAVCSICTKGIHSSYRWILLISPSKTLKTKHLTIQLYQGIVWKIDQKNWAKLSTSISSNNIYQ